MRIVERGAKLWANLSAHGHRVKAFSPLRTSIMYSQTNEENNADNFNVARHDDRLADLYRWFLRFDLSGRMKLSKFAVYGIDILDDPFAKRFLPE